MENHSPELPQRIDRRSALKWLGAATVALTLTDELKLLGASAKKVNLLKMADAREPTSAKLIGTDPVLNHNYAPGELWSLTLTEKQRRAAGSLVDLIIPPEPGDKLPSQLGVQDFVDEWISSPYDETNKDRPIIVGGLDWLDAEAQLRFHKDFADIAEAEKCKIADDICGKTPVKKEFKTAQNFFNRFRYLAASGYYTTPQGWKDIGYVGNVPSANFEGPTPEALKHLGLA